MGDADVAGASFSPAFSIMLSLSRERIAELGCSPVGEDPKAFVERGGLKHLEDEAASMAIARVRQAAYPLVFKLFGSEMPRGKARNLVLARLRQDLARITLGYRQPRRNRKRAAAKGRLGAGARRPAIAARWQHSPLANGTDSYRIVLG
jgi:hypothetical protein